MQNEPPSNTTPDADVITDALYSQILSVMGMKHTNLISRFLFFLLSKPIKRMSGILVELDQNIAKNGWFSAINQFKRHFVNNFETNGAETIPKQGPIMVVCNHPAAYDIVLLSDLHPSR